MNKNVPTSAYEEGGGAHPDLAFPGGPWEQGFMGGHAGPPLLRVDSDTDTDPDEGCTRMVRSLRELTLHHFPSSDLGGLARELCTGAFVPLRCW